MVSIEIFAKLEKNRGSESKTENESWEDDEGIVTVGGFDPSVDCCEGWFFIFPNFDGF